MKVKPDTTVAGAPQRYRFECPGCGHSHVFDATWIYDGNAEKPTVSPSLLVTYTGEEPSRCHSYIRDGRIQFLTDCTHALRGQTVDLPDVT